MSIENKFPGSSNPDAEYWIPKLARFHDAPPLFTRASVNQGDPLYWIERTFHAHPAPPRPVSLLCLGGFILVAARYQNSSPWIVAVPSARDTDEVEFLTGLCDEEVTANVFLDSLQFEREEVSSHGGCLPDWLTSELGFQETGQGRGLLRMAYAYDVRSGRINWLREHAGCLLRVEPQGQIVRLHVGIRCPAPSHEFVAQFTQHLAGAIGWLADNPDKSIADFDLLTSKELKRLVHDFNDTYADLPLGVTLPELVASQASRTPEASAVVHNDQTLTYELLEDQAALLATILGNEFDVAPGDAVGVMLQRSEKMVSALYGVMKAGAAYVPINPQYPWETVQHMVQTAGITVLIVDSDSIAATAGFTGALLVVDIELQESTPANARTPTIADTDLAYIIFTSGSTGRPKGVAVSHKAIANTILWRNHFYGIDHSDVNLQIPSFAFDSSVVDIFCVLTTGGTLVIPDETCRLDTQRLTALAVEKGITSCIVTPSYYKQLITELGDTASTLRWVTVAGERVGPELVQAHMAHLPSVELFNEYGPTENAVCSTACRIETAEEPIPIGHPIANVVVFVLDSRCRPCPIGVPGEIYLGGAGLARGYINQDELTAQRFLASPFPKLHSGRLYRTGDRGCWRFDGSLDFLGRWDAQVKIRGFRVELEEVEHALLRHPSAKNAAVLCKEDPGAMKYLAAYLETSQKASVEEIREHMRLQVPDYMVPDTLAILPRLPINLNGKIDLAALDRINDFPSTDRLPSPQMSVLETAIFSLSQDILNHPGLTPDDNFFELGGNSLRAMELTSRIRSELSVDVALVDIYAYPTVKELAERLSTTTETRADGSPR